MRRICYIHVGPAKTGTSSIQSFLKDNKDALLQQGYFVPDSGAPYGAQHWLARKLCGEELQAHQQSALIDFAKTLAETSSDAVVISSEALDGLLKFPECSRQFFDGIAALDLEPRLVLFPRHQPQWLNSRYSQQAKGFLRDDPFRQFVRERLDRFDTRYLYWIELADTYGARLIARPFTASTMRNGVVAEFLAAIGLDPQQFPNTDVRRNEAVGPFTVSVARRVLRQIGGVERLKRLQATRLRIKLGRYLSESWLEDAGYCGLTTSLAEEVERTCAADNEAFAKRMWNASWSEIFAADIAKEYTPNDFAVTPPPREIKRRMRQAIDDMSLMALSVLGDPALSTDAPWNDIRRHF